MPSVDESRRRQLQADYDLKLKQYEEVSEALRLNLSPADQPKLQAQQIKLETELRELEQALQALPTTAVTSTTPTTPPPASSVTSTPVPSATPTMQQQAATGGVNIGGNVGGDVIVHPPTKEPRVWNSVAIVGTLLALVGVIAAVIALFPEANRNTILLSLGMIAPTELPSPTPAPTPMAFSAAGFNVVVAGFGYQTAAGVIERNPLADDMSDIVAGELNQITQIDNTASWRTNGVGHILGQTAAERETQAGIIAQTLNADVVVYGIVRSDGIFNIFEPEFYITGEFAALEPELVGSDQLGNPVEFVGNSEDQILAANTFQRRLTVMRAFLRGLAFYLAGNFTGSQAEFEAALAAESDGLEVLYIFAGNAAVRIPDAQAALAFYNEALRQRPTYARALVGRGIALYRLALDGVGDTPPPFDPNLALTNEQTCSAVDLPLPDSPQLLAELALRCYTEANRSADKPNTADIDVKVAFGLGQTSLWLALNGYREDWSAVETYLQTVLTLYAASDEVRQVRIRAATGHANAWLGLRLLALDGNDAASVAQALIYYRTAIALLRSDVNREYNQRWIDLYGQQVAALETWLSERGITPQVPTLIPTQGS
jgi:hypothetical protein